MLLELAFFFLPTILRVQINSLLYMLPSSARLLRRLPSREGPEAVPGYARKTLGKALG